MQSLFITGTDTGVGKTAFCAALLAQARDAGINAAPMKPVQTGCVFQEGRWVAPDLEFMLATSGLSPSLKEKEWMCPYRFEPACSPHRAAQQAGESIRFEVIRQSFDRLHEVYPTVLVEGAGGILAPLAGNRYMLDLMKELRLPVVLAARAGLGTLNHTLLSLRELRRANLHIKAVVLVHSNPQDPDEIVADNAQTLERTADAPIEQMPFFQALENDPKNVPALGRFFEQGSSRSEAETGLRLHHQRSGNPWKISAHFFQ